MPAKSNTNTPQSYFELRSKLQADNKFHKIAKLRAHHLSSYLLNYLINAFQSGAIGFECHDKLYFQISKLDLQADMNQLNIYWLTTNDEAKNKFVEDNYLPKLAAQIRYFLSSNRVISYVPPIKFYRDNSKALIEQLEDYINNMAQEAKEAGNSGNDETEQKVEESIEVKANDEMVTNLYGVDHEALLGKLKSGGGGRSASAEKPLGATTPLNYAKFEESIKELRLHQVMSKKHGVKKEVLIESAFAEFEFFKIREREQRAKRENFNENSDDENFLN
jgi:ribosome-binding factor A